MTGEGSPVVSIGHEWAIQIFSSPTAGDIDDARLALEAETAVHVQVSEDGIQHYLVVETVNDTDTMQRVRSVVESTGMMRLDHVHLPPSDRSFVAVAGAASSDDDQAA